MRGLLLLVLLMAAAVCSAQDGPFTLYDAPPGVTLSGPQLFVEGDSVAHVLFAEHGTTSHLPHLRFSLESGTALSAAADLTDIVGSDFTVIDVAVDTTGNWLALLGSSWIDQMHGGGCLTATITNGVSTQRVFTGTYEPSGYGGSNFTRGDLQRRAGGGFLFSGVAYLPWGIEGDQAALVCAFGAGTVPVWVAIYDVPSRFLGGANVGTVSTDPDSAFVFISGGGVGPSASYFTALPVAEGVTPDSVPLGCELGPVVRTAGGRLIGAADGRLVALNRDGTCQELEASPNRYLNPATWHDRFGSVGLSYDEDLITLARYDTNGAVVQPEGELAWVEPDWRITEARVTISETGRVVVVYTERYVEAQFATRLRMVSTDWTEALPVWVGVSPSRLEPSSFSLSAHPNPFNSTLRLRYELSSPQQTTLAVYNLLGQEVARLHDGLQTAGSHELRWEPSGSTGIYLVRLTTGDEVKTQKVIYLK